MARVAAVFEANQTPESQEEDLHTDPQEAGLENDSLSREEVPGEVTLSEATGGSGWKALTNPIIMDMITNYLSVKDLVALCLASKTTKKIIDRMDSSCWKKRARKLEAVLRLEATDLTTYKERFLNLKPDVDRLVNTIKTKIEDSSGVILVNDTIERKQELASLASLIHYGMLGEVSCNVIVLRDGDLSFIPTDQLGSLVACVTDSVIIERGFTIPDLGILLDKVKSEEIRIGKILGTGDTLRLVRAMQTRVKRVSFFVMSVDFMALRTYDGKGRCEKISLNGWRLGDSIEDEELDDIVENTRQWAQTIGWDVTEKVSLPYYSFIKIERRPQQEKEM